MANIPPKADAELPTVVVTGHTGSSASFTFNDSSLYEYWEMLFERGAPQVFDEPAPPPPPAPVPAPAPPSSSPTPSVEDVISQLPAPTESVTITAPLPKPFYAPQPSFADIVAAGAPRRAPSRKPAPRPRRSKPAPKPSRRRPTRRPAPRIRIPVPAVLRGLLGKVGGVASFLPAYLAALAAVSDRATRQMYERLYGVPFDDRDEDYGDFGPGDAREDVARDHSAPQRREDMWLSESIPTVHIPGTRPRPLPVPEYLPFPVQGIGVGGNPAFAVDPAPRSRPVKEPARDPFPAPSYPDPFAAPGSPSAVPVPAPAPVPAPVPAPIPQPFAPALPNPFIGPQPGLQPFSPLAPELAPVPEPALAQDPCNCGDSDKKKRKKKKPRSRTVCFKGTYIERSRGLSKRKRQRVDCSTGKALN